MYVSQRKQGEEDLRAYWCDAQLPGNEWRARSLGNVSVDALLPSNYFCIRNGDTSFHQDAKANAGWRQHNSHVQWALSMCSSAWLEADKVDVHRKGDREEDNEKNKGSALHDMAR